MSAYKFVEDGQTVWAGKDFFYYNERRRQPVGIVGDEAVAEKAQLIQGQDQTFYHTDWLHPLPDEAAGLYEESDAVEITDAEYTAIKAVLDAGGTVETETGGTEDTAQETTEDTSLEYLKTVKIAELSSTCNAVIVGGVDVVLSDGESHHFSLSVEDQVNLISLTALLTAGQEAVPYHADGEECRYYSAADFTLITTAATAWKMYHESYFNSLKAYTNSLEDVTDLAAIAYGMEIPAEYQSEVYQSLAAQVAALSATTAEDEKT